MVLNRTAGRRISLRIHHNSVGSGRRFARPWARSLVSPLQNQLSCVPAFHRVGGWGVRPATRFVRYHFNCAVFPAVSRSLP